MQRTQQNTSLGFAFFSLFAPGVLAAQQDRPEQYRPWVPSFEIVAHAIEPTAGKDAVHKEPIIAGVLSWLLPGLGSFYAGNSAHGVRHLVIEGVGLVVFIAGAVREDNTVGSGDELIAVGYVIFIVNGVWSIVTAVTDANAYNRRGAGGGRGATAPVEVRPAIRLSPGSGGPLAPPAPRAGLAVVRLRL